MARPDLEKIFRSEPWFPGDVRIERALFTFDPTPDPRPHEFGAFHWILKPRAILIRGTVYPDGSWLDGPGQHARGDGRVPWLMN